MAYTKTNWINGQAPALSAENLNKMEEGIYNNDAGLSALTSLVNDLATVDRRSLTLNSTNWTSGSVVVTKVAGLVIIGVLNIRRGSGTNGYIDVATIPSDISVGDFVGGVQFINDGAKYLGGNFRISGQSIEANTGNTTPSYGFYAFYIYTAN